MKSPRDMGGEELKKELKKADKRLGAEIDHLRITVPTFREVLDRALALESEAARRKNGGEDGAGD